MKMTRDNRERHFQIVGVILTRLLKQKLDKLSYTLALQQSADLLDKCYDMLGNFYLICSMKK